MWGDDEICGEMMEQGGGDKRVPADNHWVITIITKLIAAWLQGKAFITHDRLITLISKLLAGTGNASSNLIHS